MRKTDVGYFHELFRAVIAKARELDAAFEMFLDRPVRDLDPVELAILRIAPGGAEAAVARDFLAGTWTPLVTIEPELPERLRVRIDQVRNELRRSEPSKRCAAGDNLVALGAAAARPVATMLSTDETDETIASMLASFDAALAETPKATACFVP